MINDNLDSLDTLPKLLGHNAKNYPNEIALREKKFGIWKSKNWDEYNTNVKQIAFGMMALGLTKGDVVGLIGDNRPDWVAGQIAIHAIGAVSIGLYRDVLEEELEYLINYSEAKAVFVEDEEQVDKFLSLGDKVSSVKHIIYEDPRGIRKYSDPRLLSLEKLRKNGRALIEVSPDLYENLVEKGDGERVAILCTTSGTTSHPKLAMLSSKALIKHSHRYLIADPKTPDDEYVSVLPLPWIMEQIYVFGKSLISRMKVNFVEEPETMMSDMREIGPTFVLFAPRVWDGIAADVRARMMDATWINRQLFNLFMTIGMRAFDNGKRSWLAERFLYSALKDRIGFSNLKSAATGGAALGPDTFKFFLAMGIPLRQLYGQTETLGAYTIHTEKDIDFDTVGVPFTNDIKVKVINADTQGVGEIIACHDNMFLGYYKNEEETAKEMNDGWMQTGDAGYFNDSGHLVVIDRIKDLSQMANGNRFSPQFIENKLKFSPHIGEAVVLGAAQDYLTAMICIRYSIVSKWAEKNRISFTTYTDLAANRKIYDLIRQEVEEINKTLPEVQKIKKFVLLYKELDADDGELTRTRKVRRNVIQERYESIIDTLYSNRDSVDIDTTITFQDGTSQRIQTTINVESVLPTNSKTNALAAE